MEKSARGRCIGNENANVMHQNQVNSEHRTGEWGVWEPEGECPCFSVYAGKWILFQLQDMSDYLLLRLVSGGIQWLLWYLTRPRLGFFKTEIWHRIPTHLHNHPSILPIQSLNEYIVILSMSWSLSLSFPKYHTIRGSGWKKAMKEVQVERQLWKVERVMDWKWGLLVVSPSFASF